MPRHDTRPETFRKLLSRLEGPMTEGSVALHPQKNPVAMAAWSTDHLAYLITQYGLLSKNAVAYLARSNEVLVANGWHTLAAVIAENIRDENGDGYPEKAHYAIFCRGARDELAIDLASTRPRRATVAFLETWLRIPATGRPAHVAGALFAFELSGVPEMQMVKMLVETYALRRTLRHLKQRGTLATFFDAHINAFEVQHAERIRSTAGRYLQPSMYRQFSSGFHVLLRAMDRWWSGLANEARSMLLPC